MVVRRNLNRISIALCIVSAFFIFGRIYLALNDGFTLGNIHSDFAYRENWSIASLPDEELVKVNRILEQPFRYLGKGAQVYAFLSNDGEYVLKIIKQKHLKVPFLQNILYYVPGFENYVQSKIDKRKVRIQDLLESCKIAYEDLQKETALIYLHLKKTENLHSSTTIIDKIGISHRLDLDDTEFLLQKKAIVLTAMIDKCMKENEEKGSELLQRLFDFLLMISKKGIAENDRKLMENVGLIGDELIFIDTGRFLKDEGIRDSEKYKKDLILRTKMLKEWLESHYPHLLATLEYELQNNY